MITSIDTPFIPVIICGGSGSRLWPRSRITHPKPFISPLGGGKSLLDMTYARLCNASIKPAAVLTVTAADSMFMCEQSASDNAPQAPHFFIGEPAGRNTAPAIALAAVWIQQRFGNNALLLALPADHLVKNTIAFWRAADSALQAAKQGHLALLGVTPTYPATGYGYIECAPQISIANTEDCFPVRRFVEKPPLEDATTFVQDGNFYWNTGIFCFTPRTLMEEMPQTAVDIMPPLQALAKTAPTDNNRWLPDTPLHAQFPNISFDYAVMEKTKKAAMAVVAGAEWNDVGSWHSLGETLPADTRGNRTDGDTLLIDCDNCLVAGGGRLIAGIALKNLHIIDSPDALLVANADSAERTREVFDQLRATNRDEATTPATVHRPWGTYTVLEESHSHKVKRIEVLPGAQLSLQSHQHRSEHWTTVTGTMTIVIGERTFDMETNQSCYISQGEKHRMANRTDQPASIIEVQVGDYFGEDDIIRYEDLYGRI